MDTQKGLKNVIYGFVGQLITMLLGIVLPRMFIVTYGSETNGLLSSVTQVIGYLSLLEAGVGTATIQALYKPIVADDKGKINQIMSATNRYYKKTGSIYAFLVIALSAAYTVLLSSSIPKWMIFTICIVNAVPNVINFYFQGKFKLLLQAEGKNYIITNLSTIFSILTSLLKIIFISLGFNVVLIQSIYILTSLLSMAFFSFYIHRNYKWLDFSAEPDYDAISEKNAVLVHQIAGLVMSGTDSTVLALLCNLQAVSIYGVYNMLFGVVSTSVSIVSESVKYVLGQAYTKGREYYLKVLDIYESYYMAFSFALYFTTYALIKSFVGLYTKGADINYVNDLFPIMFVMIKLIDTGRNAMLVTVIVSGEFSDTKWKAVAESVINLTISIAAVWKYGMFGVLSGTIVALLYRTIDAILYTNRKLLNRSSWRTFCVWIRNIALFLILAWVWNVLDIEISSYFVWIAAAIPTALVALFTFGGAAILSDVKSVQQMLQIFVRKKRRKNL